MRKRHSKERSKVFEQRRSVTGAPRVALQRQGPSYISANLQWLSLQGRHAQIWEPPHGPASSERSRDLKWYFKFYLQSFRTLSSNDSLRWDWRAIRKWKSFNFPLLSVLEENPLCKDSISNCNLVAQARLCTYQFYQQLCCQSCSRAKQDLEWKNKRDLYHDQPNVSLTQILTLRRGD